MSAIVQGFLIEIRLLGMTALDVVQAAKNDHQAFVQKVRDVLEGRLLVAADELSSDETCRLGRWYKVAPLAARQQPAYQQLEGPHRRVHAEAKRVLTLIHDHKAGEARQAFAALEATSREVLRCLDTLAAQMAAADGDGTARAA